jgi:predicted membrane chloride channel (bestrophin family)
LCNEVIVELQLGFHFNKAFHHFPSTRKSYHLIVVAIEALTRIVSPQSTMKKSPECETMAMKCKSHSHVLSCEVKCE